MKLCYVFFIVLFFSSNVKANHYISDPEIEGILKKMSETIFEVAGLDKSSIKIRLINDTDINAFVLDDGNIFINLGLISETDSPIEVMGVLSHEVAHINLNHYNKRTEEIMDAFKKSILPNIILFRLSQYSVMQEHAADKTAVIFMKKLGIPVDGLINVLKKIKDSRVQLDIEQYSTHPIIRERINYLSGNKISNTNTLLNNKEFLKSYNMVKAKIRGFVWDEDNVLRLYSNNSEEDIYAQSVTAYKSHNLKKSIEKIDQLIVQNPKNPYFYEFKAQIVLECGNISQAINLYKQAATLLPSSDIITKELVIALLTSNKAADWKKAENILLQFPQNKIDGFILEKTGLVKAKLGKLVESYLYFAKAALYIKNKANALHFLKLIKSQFNPAKFSKQILEEIEELEEDLANHISYRPLTEYCNII